jgi:hypothetical protein
MTLYVLCPDCSEERPGMRWTSKYGGNDPDVWLIPCETCGGGYRQPGCGEVALTCDGCAAEAEEWFGGNKWCAVCCAEQKRDALISGEDE